MRQPGNPLVGNNFAVSLGIVKNNADAAQHGRLQIYIPSIDSKYYKLEDLPWALYASPFGGSVANVKAGRSGSTISGVTTYGFWAIPKIGAQVLVGFLEGDPHVRYWFSSLYIPQMTRTLPQSIDGGLTEIEPSELYPQSVIDFQHSNLVKAGLEPGSLHYKTRGGYERSVSYPSNNDTNKPTTNGYGKKPSQTDVADSQTICLTSPGRHYFVMSDVDEYCRIRLKTAEGSQIIFDDTNERIYISTAQGKNWIEMDEGNGKVYIYSDSKFIVRAKNDIDFYSDENINIVAKKRVNIKSEDRSINLESNHDIRLLSNQGDVMLTASRDIHLKTVNGPIAQATAEKAVCSTDVGYVYEWAEKAGSSTSSIRLDSSNNIEGSAMQSIVLSSKDSISLRSMVSSLNLQSGTNINLNGSIGIDFTSPTIGLNAISGSEGPLLVQATGTAVSAAAAGSGQSVSSVSVVDHMILPEHEPWERDADELKCKTSRNSKYQG
jgi:uncharacterized protein (DUF2345 family)